MEFKEPLKSGFTVYTKSGCPFCSKVKKFIQENKLSYETIDCDDYLIEDKKNFLVFIEIRSNVIFKTFPVIFHDEKFIGGYQETVNYIDKLTSFDDNF